MNLALRIIIDVFIVGGCFFAFAGAVGLVRMPDTFSRMQSSTNITTLGVLLTLIAHATEGTVDIQSLWPPGASVDGVAWTSLIAWALLVLALLIFDRKSWRKAPESAIDRVPGRRA